MKPLEAMAKALKERMAYYGRRGHAAEVDDMARAALAALAECELPDDLSYEQRHNFRSTFTTCGTPQAMHYAFRAILRALLKEDPA